MKKLALMICFALLAMSLLGCGQPAAPAVMENAPAEEAAAPAAEIAADAPFAIETASGDVSMAETGVDRLKVTATPGQDIMIEVYNKAGELNGNYYQYTPDGHMVKRYLQPFLSKVFFYTFDTASAQIVEITGEDGVSTLDSLKANGFFDDVQKTVIGDDVALQAWFSATVGVSIADYLAQ